MNYLIISIYYLLNSDKKHVVFPDFLTNVDSLSVLPHKNSPDLSVVQEDRVTADSMGGDMALERLLLPSPIVKMDNALARAQWPDGGQYDLDLVMHIASKIRIDDEDFTTYRFPVSELGYGDRLDGKIYQRVRAALERLSRGSIKVDGEKDNFYFYSLFSMAGYEDGEIIVRFDPGLKSFFLHLTKNFTSFELFEMRLLPSGYSKRLFILLKSYASLPSIRIELAELHAKLLTPESFRSDFAQFRRRVLDKAQKDLESVLFFEWLPVKKGKGVAYIEFIFSKRRMAHRRNEKNIEAKKTSTKSQNNYIVEANNCAIGKHFRCSQKDNHKNVCTICDTFNLCSAEAQKGYENALSQGLIKTHEKSVPLPI